MIKQVESKAELNICLEIIRRSFLTVAEKFGLTEKNCPSHTAFMTADKLKKQLESGRPMFLYYRDEIPVGYFSLCECNSNEIELNNLAVLPEYRHFGIGKAMVEYAVDFAKQSGYKKLTIGIIEENTVLKEWYAKLGFVHTGTRSFEHLPFTVGFMEYDFFQNKNE